MTRQLALAREPQTCGWCGLCPAVTIVHDTETCEACSDSRDTRVVAYLQRIRRSGDR